MISTNELGTLKCNKRSILTPFTILIAPYAPHLAEEIWRLLGNSESIFNAEFPVFSPEYLIEDRFEYPVSINGKVRVKISFSIDESAKFIEQMVLANPTVRKWTDGKSPKKVIIVANKIINIVI
jgi:leucyl-tRNA synthetase